jgi:hypothetical protein
MIFRGLHRLQVTRKWRRKPLESLKTDSEMAAHPSRRGKVIWVKNTSLIAVMYNQTRERG